MLVEEPLNNCSSRSQIVSGARGARRRAVCGSLSVCPVLGGWRVLAGGQPPPPNSPYVAPSQSHIGVGHGVFPGETRSKYILTVNVGTGFAFP